MKQKMLVTAVLFAIAPPALAWPNQPTPQPEPTPNVPNTQQYATATTGASSATSKAVTGDATSNATGGSVGDTSAVGLGGTGGAADSHSAAGVADSGNSVNSLEQQQGIDRSGNSTNLNSLGQGQGQSVGDTISSSDNSGGNSDVQVDASDRSSHSYTAKYYIHPSLTIPVPPSVVGVGNIVVQVSPCGPMMEVSTAPVDGVFHGLFKSKRVDQGTTDTLVPAREVYKQVPLSDGTGYRLLGSQVTTYATVVGVAGARSIALGGGHSDGSYAQGSLGTSSANQRMVLKHVLSLCEIGTVTTAPPVHIQEPKINN